MTAEQRRATATRADDETTAPPSGAHPDALPTTAVRGRPATDGRTRRAIATRARIASAARDLFVQDGYTGTTIRAVARAAGVGEQTVYYSYPTKAELLVGCLDHAVDGVDRIPGQALADLARRPWVRAALAQPSAEQRLFLHVRGLAELLGRSAPVLEVVRGACGHEAVIAEAWQQDEARRRDVHHVLVSSYLPARAGEHRPADVDEAVDVVTVVLGPETWNSLVGRRSWSSLAWARWAHRTLVAELLADGAGTAQRL